MARRHRPVASGALIMYLLTAGVAALGGQSHEAEHKPAPAPAPAAAKPSPVKPPDMKTVVDRIQRRIDEEVVGPSTERASNARRQSAARAVPQPKSSAPDRRIRLLWRVSLIWPDELVAAR
ncbi:MAG: hypothetical protein ABI634_02470 [Acidobacteriota bacterium]